MAWRGVGILAAAALTGCVERLLVVRSDPPGAEVRLDGERAGETPLVTRFVFYGDREISLRKDGFQALVRVEEVSAPWWQIFPLDFFTDVLWPWTVEDRHEFAYVLTPLAKSAPAGPIEERAEDLRRRSK